MILNKRGWGFFQMLWMSGIILFFFLLTIILIYRFYNMLDYDPRDQSLVTEKSHEQMIDDLNLAARRYMENNYANIDDVNEVRLSDQHLFSSGLFAKDLYGSCSGYSIASKTNKIIFTRSYIKCNDYKSPGYDNN